ncbi:S-layer homology domain-containing protein [Calderihabitans maritimus]|uniref:SLH domain-containing protein n=1 Tax=Calderihabitans maritimus TaxID=1246530 RepID=A0A1Z5HNR8_9FIRM|nr:S-layer homology domain-containing protein [Calderihabitans maritimus]GAW91176.1 hypothetical protein Moth_0243 [Calderihabitans maritimus]
MGKELLHKAMLVTLVVVSLVLSPLAFAAEAPAPPAAYYGTVDLNGRPAPVGTVITAKIDGEVRGQITLSETGKYGSSSNPLIPKLIVNGTAADEGKLVTFEVDGVTAAETVIFKSGDVQEVNLTAVGVDAIPPTVSATDPIDGAAGVPVSGAIILTFSEDIIEGDAYDNVVVKDGNGDTVAVAKSISGNALTLAPETNLEYDTEYTVMVPAGAVKDMAGNLLENEYTFSFTTQAAPVGSGDSGGSSGDNGESSGSSGSSGGGSSGGGGGGGPTQERVRKTVRSRAATVAEMADLVRVEVPAGSVTGSNAAIVAEVVSDSKAKGAGMPLVSRVVDITVENGQVEGEITITLYYDKDRLGENQEAAVFYYNEGAQEWVRVEGTVDDSKGTVTVKVNHLTLFAVFAVDKVTFKDMENHWAAQTVAHLASMGVINGYPDGTFKPEDNITRAEAAAILMRGLKLDPGGEEELAIFRDAENIPVWARGAVAAVAREGLVKGYPQSDGSLTFEADKPISRAELAALMVRIVVKELGPVSGEAPTFADADEFPPWAEEAVAVAAKEGIVEGYPDGTFRAENTVTRAEAATMILRLLDLIYTESTTGV